jgi:hypothetical protein
MAAKIDVPENSLLEQHSDTDEEPTELGNDEIFHLLQNQRRRSVLRYLRGREGPVKMSDIAEQVAAWEHDTTVRALMSDERQRVYIALYQAHLPKLDEKGIIDYNQSRGIVEKKPLAENLISKLDTPSNDESNEQDVESDHPWATYYLGVSGVSALAIGASGLGLPVIGSLPHLFVALAIMSVYTTLSFCQVFDDFEIEDHE